MSSEFGSISTMEIFFTNEFEAPYRLVSFFVFRSVVFHTLEQLCSHILHPLFFYQQNGKHSQGNCKAFAPIAIPGIYDLNATVTCQQSGKEKSKILSLTVIA